MKPSFVSQVFTTLGNSLACSWLDVWLLQAPETTQADAAVDAPCLQYADPEQCLRLPR